MPAALFNGTAVKILKDIFKFKSGTLFITNQSADPSVSAVNAPQGSVYIQNITSGGVYIKQDTGLSTNWFKISTTNDLTVYALRNLSNLTSPVSLNQDLQPDSPAGRNLGQTNNGFSQLFVNTIKAAAGTASAIDISSRILNNSAGNTMLDFSTAGTLNASTNKITNVVNPTSAQDAATKTYVDTADGLNEKLANKGIAGGYAPLDGAAKVPYANLPSALMTYKGAWDPTTNTPTLANGTGTNGDVYRASVDGTSSAPIIATFFAGDFIIYNGSVWQRSPMADGVISVNGASGAVTVNAINQLTGDVTAGPASGSASAAATIAANAVSNAKLAQMAAHTFKGNNTGSTANPLDLTATQLTAELNIFSSTLRGLVPLSGGGTTNFLRADGTFAVPTGTGANSSLSNLIATSINQDLIFNRDASLNSFIKTKDTVGTSITGTLYITSGESIGNGSGTINITTGAGHGTSTQPESGDINISTGTSDNASSGSIGIGTGIALDTSKSTGSFSVYTGDTGSGTSGSISLITGAADVQSTRGAISLDGYQITLNGNGGNISISNGRITDALDPVSPQDVATKNYVDTNLINQFKIFYSSDVTTQSNTIASATFTTFNNSPALTFTPTVTGTYKVYCSVSLFTSLLNTIGIARITNTTGGATLLKESQGQIYGDVNTTIDSVLVQSLYTLTASTSYVFDIQGRVFTASAGHNIVNRGDIAQFCIFAELCG